MDKSLEIALIIISAVFVLYTAMIDPQASFVVAVVAVICLMTYHMMFGKKETKKVATTRKIVVKKAVKKAVRSKRK
jgi:hypothetical protein